jgi:hypothetical protein
MRKILITVISIVALAALVGCGSSNSASTPSNPSGGNDVGFSNSNLKGTYVFSGSGLNSSGDNFDITGVFTADGNGSVTSGVRDIYADPSTSVQSETISGSYSISQDGRGQLTLTGSSTGQSIYRFVMQSPSAASFFQFSSNADDTGRIQLQSTVSAPTGTYVVRLDGEDSSGNVYGAIGGLTISGTSVSGTMDENDTGTLTTQETASGSLTAPNTNGRGTLQLIYGGVTRNFVYYFTSANHFELASTDGYILHGYADLQTSVSSSTSAFTGDQVYALTGYYSAGTMQETGRLTLGSGLVTNGVEDYLQGPNSSAGNLFSDVTFTGTYTVGSNGRWTAQVGAAAPNFIGWQVSPTQSVLLTSNTGSTLLETGTMRAQDTTVTTSSINGPYAVNLSGYNYNDSGYVELGGNFDANGSGTLSGTVDSQTPGYYNTDISTSGQYSIQSNGRSPNGNIGGVSVVIYTVDADTAYVISSDNTRLYQGKMVLQQP